MGEELLNLPDRKQKLIDYLQNNDDLKKLHNGSERYVYPYIPQNIDQYVRDYFNISKEETVIFTQIYEKEKAYTVVTDYCMRVAYEEKMNYAFATWDSTSRWVYNGTQLVFFDDLLKITIPIHIDFFSNGTTEKYRDLFGESLSEIFNYFCSISPYSSEKEYNTIVSNYISKCKEDDLSVFVAPNQHEVDRRKKYYESHRNSYVIWGVLTFVSIFFSIATGGFCLIFTIILAIVTFVKATNNGEKEYLKEKEKAQVFYEERRDESLEDYRNRKLEEYCKEKERMQYYEAVKNNVYANENVAVQNMQNNGVVDTLNTINQAAKTIQSCYQCYQTWSNMSNF